MSHAARLWLLVAPAALAVGAAASVLTATSDHLNVPGLQAVLTALIGGSFVVAGLIARSRRPLNRTGWLLIAVGFTWLLGGIWGSEESLLWTLGVAVMAVPAGFLIHLLLAYPSGRLQSTWERFVVVTGYVLVTVGHGSHLLVEPDPLRCDECPSNAFLVSEQDRVAEALTSSLQTVAVVYLLAVVGTLVSRWSAASPAARGTLTPVFLAGGATLLLFAVSVGAQSFSYRLSEITGWIASFVVIGVPFLFLSGLLKGRLARADISRALAEELEVGVPQEVQKRVRDLLHDPTAELLLACIGDVGCYEDLEGNRRNLDDAKGGRAVLPIEREGRPLAAIVHDRALLEEPELLEQVAAAVGLKLELDHSVFELRASERRSRALLEAIPDSMFRISRDGRILDYRVEPPVKLFRPEEGMVGSDVYDTDFPREITERNMALGAKALDTGELQVHEYQVEIDGEVRDQEARITRSGTDEFLLIVRDVTERKRQEEELRRSEKRSRALLEAVPDNLFRISGDGIFLDIQESTGSKMHPVEANVGSSIYDYPGVPRELIEEVMTAGKLALQTGELQTIEWELGTEGDRRHQEGRFMRSGENEFFLVVRDVTLRKQQEIEQAALHRVALAVARERPTERIFDLVTREAGRVLGAHSAYLVRYEPGGEEAVMVGSWSQPGAAWEPVGQRFRTTGAASHMVYQTGRPVRLELKEGNVSPEFAGQMREWGVDSLVAAPITVTGRLWGAVGASLRAPDSFPRGAEERLAAFTQLVSLALANEEARQELAASRARLVSAGDEERRRLERNLHDGAQQRLVSVSLSLRLAQAKLTSDPRGAEELLSAANAELAVALEELRELARGIHPAVLTERGLGPALESLADRTPVPVALELLTDQRLPGQVEAAAYYVVSEALANVAKYARASAVDVRVAQQDGRAVIEVVDDGVGGADPEQGSGLRGLADRVEALDGRLSVASRAGKGTTVRAEIPLPMSPLDALAHYVEGKAREDERGLAVP
jgi:PAS domain S-box-containing protein